MYILYVNDSMMILFNWLIYFNSDLSKTETTEKVIYVVMYFSVVKKKKEFKTKEEEWQ